MVADFLGWLPLVVKLVLTAGIVVTASVLTERAGPLIGALVFTLPVTVWPAYLFLSFDHDAVFMAESALIGLVVNAVSGIFMLAYAALAQRRGLFVSIGLAIACWIVLALTVRFIAWNIVGAILLNLFVYPLCLWIGSRFREAKMPRIQRQWYELPLRTLLVCALMGAVLSLSNWVGAVVTGILAVYPISSTSTMLILHSRLGGPVSAAVIANGLSGMIGITLGLAALQIAIMPFGVVTGLALALAIPIIWNLTIWVARRRGIPL